MYSEPMWVYMGKAYPYEPKNIKGIYTAIFIAKYVDEEYKYAVIHLQTAKHIRRYRTLKEAKAFATYLETDPCTSGDALIAAMHYKPMVEAYEQEKKECLLNL